MLAMSLARHKSPSGYAIFTKYAARTMPQVGCAQFVVRTRAVAAAWNRLPAASKAQFMEKAAQTRAAAALLPPPPPQQPKRESRLGRHKYHTFVRDNYPSVIHLSFTERMQVISKRWQDAKKAHHAASVAAAVS